MRRSVRLILIAVGICCESVCTQPFVQSADDWEMTKPLSPEESLKAMHVRPGMKIELVAAEPLVVDPVAFDWGPDGRLWVVEMRDYPSGITWKKEGDEFGKPGGRVKVLTDVDGDGKYDKATVFLDEIPFPTGVKVWRKGILVTAAPEILYAEDKDGDDKADERKVLYRGFGEGNQQHRVNGLRWGLDNWLYVGNGDSGGVIRAMGALSSPHAPREEPNAKANANASAGHVSRSETATLTEVNVAGRDLRIRPDTGELEAVSGNTQFGRECDDWGNWFGNNNSNPLWHYALDDRYLRRNPFFAPPPVKKDVSVTPGAAPVYPRSKTLKRFNDDNKANRYTSACGPTIYRDELLGAEFYNNYFVCEPVHNLVSREIMTAQGSTFTSRRADDEKQSEFLASEDNWFRPSMCRTGPDGALWVADMYRFVIEHPKWIPSAAQAKLDMRAGDDKGRIYRIYPEGKQPRRIARLDYFETVELVAALDTSNGPQRDLVQQMLVWRRDKAAIEPLRKLASSAHRPQTRLQALCTLEGLGGLSMKVMRDAFDDAHFAVRRQAVRIAESRLNEWPELAASMDFLASDKDSFVKVQVAYSLGEWNDRERASGLTKLLLANTDDSYLMAAALSSVNKETIGKVLSDVLAAGEGASGLRDRVLSMAAAMGQDEALVTSVKAILQPQPSTEYSPWQFTTIATIQESLARRKTDLRKLLDSTGQAQLDALVKNAWQIVVAEAGQPNPTVEPFAIAAMSVLGRGLSGQNEQVHVGVLTSLLAPRYSPEIRAASVASLVRTGKSFVPTSLLAGWSAHGPALRTQILDALATREDWSLALLSAVESGDIPASQFDARRRQQFVAARSKAVREKAEKVLAGAVDPNRQKLVETYLAAAKGASGDADKGRAAFVKRCANCHKLEGAGNAVGPDLAPLTGRPADYLLTSILDPNRAVEDRYVEYVALTTDGRQLTGILLEETGASLTLAAPEGKKFTIPRGELEQIKSSGKSLMPEGIERDVSAAEMVDILAYLKKAAPEPKHLALNQPEVVQPFNDGSIRLFASNCRAYGPTIKMEEQFHALGWWNSTDDYCAWSFDVSPGGAGDYRVTLEYSCAENSAGNTVVVEANGQSLTGKVVSSGGWEKYRGWNIGTLKLAEGRNELVVRSSGPIKNALFDLGGMRLVPVR